MTYEIKLIIDGVTVMGGDDSDSPSIFSLSLQNTACSEALQLGAVTTDCLQAVIANPFKDSFDGSTIELWVSPQEDSSLDAVAEIDDEVGDETADEVIDEYETSIDSDEEEGEDLTDAEIEEVEELTEATTAEQYALFEGEALADTISETPDADAEWHKVGVYHVVKQTNTTEGVRLIAYDNLQQLGTPFLISSAETLQTAYNRLVTTLADNGITLEANTMPDRACGINYTGTCREALGYFAGLLGGFASCDADGSLDISSYLVSDAVLIEEELLSYQAASGGEMTVGGIILKSQNGQQTATVGDGQTITVINPLMIESDLNGLMSMYQGLRFEGATLSSKWNESLMAGTLVRVYTKAEYENYLKLMNNETMTDDLKAMANSLGRVILISSQTISFGSEATTVISSAQTTISDMITQSMAASATDKIAAAGQTATNYLNQDNTGALVISNDQNDSNVRLDSDSVDIRNGETLVASFGADSIYLAKNDTNAAIFLAGDDESAYIQRKNDGKRLTLTTIGADKKVSLFAMRDIGGGNMVGSFINVLPEGIDIIAAGAEGAAPLNLHGKVFVNDVKPLKTQAKTFASRSWGAKGTALSQYNYQPDAIDGYTCVGIVGAYTDVAAVQISASYEEGHLSGNIYNHNSSATSAAITAKFIYAQNGII